VRRYQRNFDRGIIRYIYIGSISKSSLVINPDRRGKKKDIREERNVDGGTYTPLKFYIWPVILAINSSDPPDRAERGKPEMRGRKGTLMGDIYAAKSSYLSRLMQSVPTDGKEKRCSVGKKF
jgi:hypothetical protein